MTKLTDAQLQAAKSVDKNVLVAAGAGSGKTSVLVERALEILRSSPEAKFSQLVAVTYTRKAAAEMQTRIKQEIHKLATQSGESESDQWLRHLSEIDTAKIGTIHSLCESILQSFAIEAGIDPQFRQLDDIARATLQNEAVKEALKIVITEQTKEHELLLEYSLDQLSDWLGFVLKFPIRYREATEKLAALKPDGFKLFLQELLETVQLRVLKKMVSDPRFQKASRELADLASTDSVTNIGEFRADTLNSMLAIKNAVAHQPGPAELANCWQTLHSLATNSIRNRGTKKVDETIAVKDALKLARATAIDYFGDPKNKHAISARIEDDDLAIWHHTQLLMSLAERTLAIYQELKATEGIDYDDLIAMVSSVLSQDKSKIKEHFHRSVSHILVDEFQDTNMIQSRLVNSLAGPSTRRFLIGDDKQSIYKFQGAEVALFNKLRSEFEGSSSAQDSTELVIELAESFRSHPKIVDFFNAVFEKLFVDHTSLAPYHALYRPLSVKAEADTQDHSEHVEIIEYASDDRQRSSLLESKLIADRISRAVADGQPIKERNGARRPIGFGDVAVLVSSNDMFKDIEDALSAAHIPYVRFGGKGFLERQEIYDLENLLDFLDNQNDDHALIGLLRSPVCALPDDLIHGLFVNQEEPFWKVLERQALAKRQGYELVAQSYYLLKRIVEDSQFLTVAQLLRKFIQTTSYDITLLGTRNGKQRSRNLWKLVHMASQKEELSCREFADQLRMMRDLKVQEKDAPVDAKNSVKLMTIHGSKGLEFPAVILPRLNNAPPQHGNKILLHQDYGMAIDTTRIKDEPPPLYYRLARWLEQDMEAAEKRRLLYVAMTRARDYLTIVVPAGTSEDQTSAGWLRAIVFRPPEGIVSSGSEILAVPGTRATFELKRITQPEIEALAPPVRLPIATPEPAEIMKPVLAHKPRHARKIEPASDQVKQLSLFAFADETPEDQAPATQSQTATAPGKINYSLIDPVPSQARDFKNNALAARRISPRQGHVELSPILVGNYFHALLERLPPGKKQCDRIFLRNVALLQGNEVAHKDALADLIGVGENLLLKYFESELFEILERAIERHHELPYMMILDDRLDTKRPDLLIKKPDQSWHVIDYKTDVFPAAEIERQAATHRKQLEGYATELFQLLGTKVSTHLYFAQHALMFELL
jgi:ATP-dependent helicase/nuclease subunit A